MDIELFNRYIMCVHKVGSLTQAAKDLGISQPALSSAVRNMENHLGFKIFDRKNSPLLLTEEGKVYIEYLRKQQLLVRDYQREIADIRNKQRGKLVIGAPSAYAERILANGVFKLRKEQPIYDVMIKNAQVSVLLEWIKNGEIDCFISTSEDLPKELTCVKVKKETIYLCIPESWEINKQLENYRVQLNQTGKTMNYSVLNNMEFIFLEKTQPLQERMDQFLEENSVLPRCHLRVDQVSLGISLATKGLGICFASEEALTEDVLRHICLYTLPDNISQRNIYVAYDKEKYVSQTCLQLIEILQNIEKENN